jgi:hypothetical protein
MPGTATLLQQQQLPLWGIVTLRNTRADHASNCPGWLPLLSMPLCAHVGLLLQFVCTGLVSPDRIPHPAAKEFKHLQASGQGVHGVNQGMASR